MFSMFGYCESLISLDLSFFDTNLVTIIKSIFNIPPTNSLQYLDISHFNAINANLFYLFYYDTFYDLSNLKYLDIYHVEDFDKYIIQAQLKDLEKIIVCQKKINEKTINK